MGKKKSFIFSVTQERYICFGCALAEVKNCAAVGSGAEANFEYPNTTAEEEVGCGACGGPLETSGATSKVDSAPGTPAEDVSLEDYL